MSVPGPRFLKSVLTEEVLVPSLRLGTPSKVEDLKLRSPKERQVFEDKKASLLTAQS